MPQSIYGLSYEYVDKNGRYLVVSRDNVLTNQDLNNIQVKMLLANNIPYLVPIEIEERDFAVRIRYALGFMRTLKNFTHGRQLRPEEYYQFLLSLLNAIDDSKAYMLEEDKFLLNSNFIFIGRNLNEIYLVYLPLNRVDENHPSGNQKTRESGSGAGENWS
jgi:CRISPR/Cas system CSM-associated protein Csm2 small subunit